MMECLQSIDPVQWIFPCSAFVLREKREENLNSNMNSFWRWWESMSTPQLMAPALPMDAWVRGMRPGETFIRCVRRKCRIFSVNDKTWIQLTSTFFPSSWRAASSSAYFPDFISVSSSINHITTLLHCKSRLCLVSNGGKRVSCIWNFASSIIQRRRGSFHGVSKTIGCDFALSPASGHNCSRSAACNQCYSIVAYAIAHDDATTCDVQNQVKWMQSRKSKCIRHSPSDRFTQKHNCFLQSLWWQIKADKINCRPTTWAYNYDQALLLIESQHKL